MLGSRPVSPKSESRWLTPAAAGKAGRHPHVPLVVGDFRPSLRGAIGENEDLLLGHAADKSTGFASSPPSRIAAGP